MADEHSRYILREDDVIFTDDVYDAMSDGFIGTCLHIIITSGEMSFKIGEKQVVARINDCLIMPNRAMINDIRISDDFTMKSVIISQRFMRISLPKSNYEMKGLLAMAENPVIRMTAEEAQTILHDFVEVQLQHSRLTHIYYAEMVARSIEMMVLDMYDIHSRYHAEELSGIDQSARITRQFIALLQQGYYHKNRKVEFYASLLHITPQYLSECCIKATGHNASFYIDYFATEEIARLLKRDDLTITDIAYKLDFNTTNYFTRYVKRTLGMTPREYRAKFNLKQKLIIE